MVGQWGQKNRWHPCPQEQSRVEKFVVVDASVLSCVWLFETPRTVAHQTPVHGISQARIQEWVAISFFRRSRPRDWTHISCIAGTEPLTRCCLVIYRTRQPSLYMPKIKYNHSMWICLVSGHGLPHKGHGLGWGNQLPLRHTPEELSTRDTAHSTPTPVAQTCDADLSLDRDLAGALWVHHSPPCTPFSSLFHTCSSRTVVSFSSWGRLKGWDSPSFDAAGLWTTADALSF